MNEYYHTAYVSFFIMFWLGENSSYDVAEFGRGFRLIGSEYQDLSAKSGY